MADWVAGVVFLRTCLHKQQQTQIHTVCACWTTRPAPCTDGVRHTGVYVGHFVRFISRAFL